MNFLCRLIICRDTTGAPVVRSTVTEYTPLLIRDIQEIKAAAKAQMNSFHRSAVDYRIAPLNTSSPFIRPTSLAAQHIRDIYEHEKKALLAEKRMSFKRDTIKLPSKSNGPTLNNDMRLTARDKQLSSGKTSSNTKLFILPQC